MVVAWSLGLGQPGGHRAHCPSGQFGLQVLERAGGRGNVAQLLHEPPGAAVQKFFIVSLLLYVVGVAWVLRPRTAGLIRDGR
jgi:hypothetical protein